MGDKRARSFLRFLKKRARTRRPQCEQTTGVCPRPNVIMGLTVHHDNFYFSDEQISNSPSRKDGVSDETEFKLKVYGCELVQEGAILLRVNQAVACTGQTLLHRFYAKRSLKKFDIERVAATSCFLACKLEEQPRKLRDVINVFHRQNVRRKKAGASVERSVKEGTPLNASSETDYEPLQPQSEAYELLKQDLIRTERHCLREFGFCIQVEHPHKFVLNYLRMFEHGSDKRLVQSAWAYANDSCRTNLCIRFKADEIAVACVHLANRTSPEIVAPPLPEEKDGAPKNWWHLFDVDDEELKIMCESILALYRMCPPGGERAKYVDVHSANENEKK